MVLSSANDSNWRTRSATLTYLRTFMYRYSVFTRVFMYMCLILFHDLLHMNTFITRRFEEIKRKVNLVHIAPMTVGFGEVGCTQS